MSEAKVEHYTTNHSSKGPMVNGNIAIQTLVRNIEAAHENGALFFLAAQLGPLLDEFREKNGPSTAMELEALVIWAARAMVDE